MCFSTFTTCPVPENKLSIKINAGEKTIVAFSLVVSINKFIYINDYDRRSFIKRSLLGIPALTALPSISFAEKPLKIGLAQWSLHRALRSKT